MARRYFKFPVNKTGVYKNEPESKLEFWFFNPDNGKKKKVGECRMDCPQYLKDAWEESTANQLKALVASILFPNAHNQAPCLN